MEELAFYRTLGFILTVIPIVLFVGILVHIILQQKKKCASQSTSTPPVDKEIS